MKKITILIVFSTLIAQALFAQLSADNFKNKTNAEVVSELKTAVEQLKSIERLSTIFRGNDGEVFTKDELDDAFILDTLMPVGIFNELRTISLIINQTPTEKGSELLINAGYFFKDLTGRSYEIKLIPKRFYFADGSTADKVEGIKMDFSFPEDIPFKKQIDSIDCELSLNYVTAYDQVEVTDQKPVANYKGKSLKLLKADKNDIELIYNKDLVIDFFEGLNAAGKPLEHKSHSTTDLVNRDFKVFAPIVKSLENIIASAEKDLSMEKSAFQQKYLKQLDQEFAKIPKSDTLLTMAKYRGTIKGARFWIAKERKSQNVKLTIKRES